jgi:hypothetical protein
MNMILNRRQTPAVLTSILVAALFLIAPLQSSAVEVTVSGTVVGCAETPSSLTIITDTVAFDTISPGSSASKIVNYSLIQGKFEDCSNRNAFVSPRVASVNGVIVHTIHENFTFLSLEGLENSPILLTATAPDDAALSASTVKVELTLFGDK